MTHGFLANAPVLTGEGYIPIHSVRVGDRVMTPTGTYKVTKLSSKTYTPGRDTNPYIIPDGRFEAVGSLRISPGQRVYANGHMIESSKLCLEQEDLEGPITYYNIGVEGGHTILVAGVEVESLVSLYKYLGDVLHSVLDS